MSIDDFLDHYEKLDSLESNELQKINDSNTGGYTHMITFTTIGRLHVYKEAFEMADIKRRITSEINVSGNNSLAVLGIGISDFHHSYFPMLYSIIQSESKCSVFVLMKINMEIMKKLEVKLKKQYPITYAILKDGGSSFVRPSIELHYDQED